MTISNNDPSLAPSKELILPKMLTRTLDQLPEPYAIKDLSSRYIYANLALVKLTGLRSPDDMLYKREYEFQSRLMENETVVNEWQNQDRIVANGRKPLTMLEIHPEAVEFPYIVRKVPFYDDNNNCAGVITYSKNLEVFTLKDFAKGNTPGSLLLSKPDDFFSEKECEIIFLKLQGMTSKEVGNRLHLSPRTVDNRLMRLYDKVGVNHFDDFSEFCEQRDYNRYLPKKFILQQKVTFEKKLNRVR
ncbi:helix-turn-helix transcriptional regulator [Winslowiella iniecta]|uniref:Transcriptional regulator n=1 Tax=Winslowiella iniecta TaxID=1560201 RepID=A0A0L7TAW4_9GAMM|nr:PAS and helix-turn-helix domain-containing protein [Winslowiella iniecta]KOC89490.1 transcriptional regulator [Winslowiella iniecta]KOC92507.1 transcriptional regulator [Winslowiella iniecta]